MSEDGVAARRLAIEVLERVEVDGAYANLLLPKLLEESQLDTRDRGFVTELTYGSTRMLRALDFAADRFIDREDVDSRVRAAVRVGAYQLLFMRVPAHAAVDATVGATPKRGRGFVNAVLRKIAKGGDPDWPTVGHRLSYPKWIVDRLTDDLGDRAVPVLESMNEAATTHTRPDGYRQDSASQAVAALVDPEGLTLDLCAAPGGKATYVAGDSSTGQSWALTSMCTALVLSPPQPRRPATRCRASLLTPRTRHTGTPVPTQCWSTRPVRGWGRYAVGPTLAGASNQPTSTTSQSCSSGSSNPQANSSNPVGRWCSPCARSPTRSRSLSTTASLRSFPNLSPNRSTTCGNPTVEAGASCRTCSTVTAWRHSSIECANPNSAISSVTHAATSSVTHAATSSQFR